MKRGLLSISREKATLLLVYLLPIFCAFHNNALNELISISVLILICFLYPSKRFYDVLPVVLFYYIQLRFMGGSIVVYRIYSLLLLTKLIREKVVPINRSKVPALFLSVMFSIVVLYQYQNLQYVIMLSFDLIVMAFMGFYLRKSEIFFSFSKSYILAAASASVYNFIGGRATPVLQNYDEVLRTVKRYVATFNDPNYTGFYFMIALFLLITLKPYSKIMNVGIGCLIVFTIVSTVSTTAFIGMALITLVYLILDKKYTLLKKMAILLGVLFLLILLIRYGYYHPDTPFLGDAVFRFGGKFGQLFSASDTAVSDFTTGRSSGSRIHIQTFLQQPLWKMLIGFNPICAVFRDTSFLMESALNEYIDLLLSVGIIGWGLIIIPFVLELIRYFNEYKITKDRTIQARLFIKIVWLYYGFALCFFMDSKFYFFYFL